MISQELIRSILGWYTLPLEGIHGWLYARAGLDAAYAALRAAGVLAVWSASPDRAFAKRLCRAGFEVTEVCVRAWGPRVRVIGDLGL